MTNANKFLFRKIFWIYEGISRRNNEEKNHLHWNGKLNRFNFIFKGSTGGNEIIYNIYAHNPFFRVGKWYILFGAWRASFILYKNYFCLFSELWVCRKHFIYFFFITIFILCLRNSAKKNHQATIRAFHMNVHEWISFVKMLLISDGEENFSNSSAIFPLYALIKGIKIENNRARAREKIKSF